METRIIDDEKVSIEINQDELDIIYNAISAYKTSFYEDVKSVKEIRNGLLDIDHHWHHYKLGASDE